MYISFLFICCIFVLQKRERAELSSRTTTDSQGRRKKKQFLWKSFSLKKFCLHFLLIIQHPGCVKKYENTFPGGELQSHRPWQYSWVVICFLEFHFLINTSVKSLRFQSLASTAAVIKAWGGGGRVGRGKHAIFSSSLPQREREEKAHAAERTETKGVLMSPRGFNVSERNKKIGI